MLITCKCLNISVEMKAPEARKMSLECFKLSPIEESDEFFREGFEEIELVRVKKHVTSLVQARTVGVWTIEQCMNCSINCYATSIGRPTLASKALVYNLDSINQMKNHRDYSPVFRIIIKPLPEDSNPQKSILRQSPQKIQMALTALKQQLGDAVQDEVSKAEERIRTFSQQTYDELKEFRNRAKRDHDALISRLYQAQRPLDQEPRPVNEELSTSSGSPDGHLPHVDRRVITRSKTEILPITTSNAIGVKGHRALTNRSLSVYSPSQNNRSASLDSETMFVIEGMEDNSVTEPCHSEGESDTDHDDSGSHDEGIDVHRKRASSIQLAKSLPVNVPVYPVANTDFEPDDESQDPVDIAASIKALAQSVHGDAVFGELPRPRVSTQI